MNGGSTKPTSEPTAPFWNGTCTDLTPGLADAIVAAAKKEAEPYRDYRKAEPTASQPSRRPFPPRCRTAQMYPTDKPR